MQYVWLIILWLLYGVLHSVFAAAQFKQWVKACMKSGYRYYRPLYSLFATISLVAVLWYHFTIAPQLLWQNFMPEKIIAVLFVIPAIVIMTISIKKYFMYLSGVDVFIKKKMLRAAYLEQTGLHKYVRHPLYFGTLLFVWGIFLWQPTLSNAITCSCITIYTVIGTYFEEKKLVVDFGDAYILYTQKVPMLLPGTKW